MSDAVSMEPKSAARSDVATDRPRRWSVAASVTAMISALAASACCLGPLVLALLGLGGAGFLIKFEPYRPYLMGITVAMLGGGFLLTYRRPKIVVTSSAECQCARLATAKRAKVVLWIATILVAAFLAFPYLMPVLFR